MSCGCRSEQETDSSPSLLDKKSVYEKAIQAIKEAKPDDITQQVTYMDENCHGCLVGHLLKVTDGLNYEQYNKDLSQHNELRYESLVRKLMNKNFGTESFDLDVDLSTIHDDYINDDLSFEEMQEKAIECLEAFRDDGHYGYESVRCDYDDDYEDE